MAGVFLFSADDDGLWPSDDGDAWLAPEERARAGRFADLRTARRYRRSVFVLRRLLAQAGVGDAAGQTFRRGRHGKPDSLGGVHFSLGRSQGAVIVGMSKVGPIGVDIEQDRPPSSFYPHPITADWPDRYPALAAQLDAADLPLRGTATEARRTFLRAWTRLEAQVKRDGQSLARVLDGAVSVSGADRRGRLVDIDALPGAIAACALSDQDEMRVVVGWQVEELAL